VKVRGSQHESGLPPAALRDQTCPSFKHTLSVFRAKRRMGVPLPGVLAQFNTGVTGRNAGLPETYGLKPEALAELMTRWRERALNSHAT
jgi:hypothetical protein